MIIINWFGGEYRKEPDNRDLYHHDWLASKFILNDSFCFTWPVYVD